MEASGKSKNLRFIAGILIMCGIAVQLLGRVIMMFCNTWVPFMIAYLIQSIGGGMFMAAYLQWKFGKPGIKDGRDPKTVRKIRDDVYYMSEDIGWKTVGGRRRALRTAS